jgi:uncharacterized repeat protein (TIGR02543 family)
LTAIPDSGFHFTEWSGSIADQVNPISIVMDSNKTIRANFEGNGYVLTVLAQNGSVDVQPDQAIYAHGTTVTLTATPATGYHFIGWTGAAASVLNPLVVTMDSDKTVTANFALNEYMLNVLAQNGSVEVQPNQSAYLYGTTVTLTAQPADGFRFAQWSGSTSGTLNPLVLIMDSDKSLTAHFTTAAPGNSRRRTTCPPTRSRLPGMPSRVRLTTRFGAESFDGDRTALSEWIAATSFVDDSVVPGVTYVVLGMAAKVRPEPKPVV